MDDIIYTLIEITITSAVIAGVILLFRQLFRKSISPKFQYIAWMLLIARLVVPVTIESGLHLDALLPQPAAVEQAAPAAEAVPDTAPAVYAENEITPVQAAAPAAPVQTVQRLELPGQPTEQTSAPAPAPVNWQLIVLCVWAAGVLVTAAWMTGVKLRYGSRITSSVVPVHTDVKALFTRCKRELNVHGNIKFVAVDQNISPGLTLIRFRPLVMIPSSLLGDLNATRYAMLHELTHYRRRDHLMLMLMTALNCIYWFDPVLWLAFPEMRSDMETACDAQVIKNFDADGKREYLVTLLRLFHRQSEPTLGMAKYQTRRLATKRLKGAFMSKKTKPLTLITAAIVAILMVAVCFTTACQPSPEIEVVAPVAEHTEKIDMTSPTPTATDTASSDSWEETLTDEYGNQAIIKADVINNAAEQVDIMSFRWRNFTQDEIASTVEYFVGDAQLYTGYDGETKASVKALLDELAALVPMSVEEREAQVGRGDYTDDQLQADIATLEERYAAAPESNSITETSVNDMQTTQDGQHLDVYAGTGGDDDVVIWAFNNAMEHDGNSSVSLRLRNAATGKGILPASGDAVATAQKVVEDLGYTDLRVWSAEPCAASNDINNTVTNTRVYFDRTVCGLPWRSGGIGMAEEDTLDFATLMPPSVSVDVGSGGVTAFMDSGSVEMGDTIEENVTLLPFEQISRRSRSISSTPTYTGTRRR